MTLACPYFCVCLQSNMPVHTVCRDGTFIDAGRKELINRNPTGSISLEEGTWLKEVRIWKSATVVDSTTKTPFVSKVLIITSTDKRLEVGDAQGRGYDDAAVFTVSG